MWSHDDRPGAQEGKVDINMKTFEPTEAGSGSLVMPFSLLWNVWEFSVIKKNALLVDLP